MLISDSTIQEIFKYVGVPNNSITTRRRNFQTGYKKTDPTSITICRWVEKLNNLGHAKIISGREMFSVSKQTVQPVNSFFHQHVTRFLKNDVQHVGIPDFPLPNIQNKLVRMCLYKKHDSIS